MVSNKTNKKPEGTDRKKVLEDQYLELFEDQGAVSFDWRDEDSLDQPPSLQVAETYTTYNIGEKPIISNPGIGNAELE